MLLTQTCLSWVIAYGYLQKKKLINQIQMLATVGAKIISLKLIEGLRQNADPSEREKVVYMQNK